MFLTESWFWRGTQSAIFFYVSCAPCVDLKYKRQRRKEAERSEKERAKIITAQPGLILQPGPFQTNPDWAEEILMGPGPPPGWKKDKKALAKYTQSLEDRQKKEAQMPLQPTSTLTPAKANVEEHGPQNQISPRLSNGTNIAFMSSPSTSASTETTMAVMSDRTTAEPMTPISETTTGTTASTSQPPQSEQNTKSRPSMDRRLSTAVENIKDTIKGWNLKRYEREDEILSGLTERITKLWDRATSGGIDGETEGRKLSGKGRKRAGTTGTTESDRFEYLRSIRNPEINEMHPPTVSKLPSTRDEAAWMLLPPPSAAVMAGRARPRDEQALRWPLAQIDRTPDEIEHLERERALIRHHSLESTRSTNASKKTPDLSNSSSDEDWTEDEEGEEDIDYGSVEYHEHHSTPLKGWTPVLPKASVSRINHGQQWRRNGPLNVQNV